MSEKNRILNALKKDHDFDDLLARAKFLDLPIKEYRLAITGRAMTIGDVKKSQYRSPEWLIHDTQPEHWTYVRSRFQVYRYSLVRVVSSSSIHTAGGNHSDWKTSDDFGICPRDTEYAIMPSIDEMIHMLSDTRPIFIFNKAAKWQIETNDRKIEGDNLYTTLLRMVTPKEMGYMKLVGKQK